MNKKVKWILKYLVLILVAANVSAQTQPLEDQVWFSPNVGSVDMLDLFTTPEFWETTRSRIDIFKFNGGNVATGGWSCVELPHYNCGDNHIQNFIDVDAFSKLGQWGIGIALESYFAGPVMSLDPLECSTPEYIRNMSLGGSINIIQSVQGNGGTVTYLAMDEPLRRWLPEYYYEYTGQTDPRPCLADSIDTLADYMADYILQMNTWFPSVQIGHIELYPEVGVDQFKAWIQALEARGVHLPFLHLDVHGPRVDSYISFGLNLDVVADLLELKSFCESHDIALGVIFTDIYWDSRYWEEGSYTDATYYQATLDWIESVKDMGVVPHHSIYQSWVKPHYTTGSGPNEVPINLPENNVSIYSHTRLVNEALGPTPSPTPVIPDTLGVRLAISSTDVQPGDAFWLMGYLDNPGPSRMASTPVVFILDVFGYYYFWPSWSLYHPPEAQEFDFEFRDIVPGSTGIPVVSAFTWPDTGNQTVSGLRFYGAMLDQEFSSILGDYDYVEWGFGS